MKKEISGSQNNLAMGKRPEISKAKPNPNWKLRGRFIRYKVSYVAYMEKEQTNLTGNKAAWTKIMLKKKNDSLQPHGCAQAYTPDLVGLYTHEVVWASKDI